MKNLAIITIALLLVHCEPLVPQQSTVSKQIVFDNHDYEDIIGFAKILPIENGQVKELENPIVGLNEAAQLMLSFDLLSDQFENLSARIIHCNRGWSKSVLRDMEFLNQINNYRITDFNYSVNTVQPYINYTFQIDKPKLSGNYLLVVYRRANPDDILLSRKFMVIDSKVSIDHTVRVSTTVSQRDKNQQIEYGINYGNLLVNTPTRDINTVLLQNNNWNTAITDTPPTLIRANDGYLEFRHLDLKTNFYGWNEFRFADLRTLNVSGRNVGRITNTGSQIIAPLKLAGSRGDLTYIQNFQDINGNFLIQNTDPGEDFLNADYANVKFSLKSDQINGNVYVWGQFNDWQLNDLNRMQFTTNNGVSRYETNIPLKQGYYEFLYFVESNDLPAYYFEGSHFQTENQYEILVYYRKPGNVNDELVGYKRFISIEP
ncbi:type IX secretion system plug protein domain-containing protein [Ekhidna sp. To15]|uniref:type IX secretion system plug protein n=1 Tax=Ekhidna sp. To15 TaxID=3395267 RepID=UPI003F5282D2